MTDDQRTLDECRDAIDRIDGEMLQLLAERAKAAQRVGVIKHAAGDAIFAPHRERKVHEKLCARNPGPLTDHSILAIWREIISGCISLEEPLTICHFGQPGSFTHQASRARFGDSVSYAAIESIPIVFETVERGHADYGVVPIENSTDGGITDTIDAFLATNLRIVSEMHLRVRHHLMARCEQKDIKRVYSKHTVFGQCRQWLATHLPGVDLVETVSTTQAAEKAAKEEGSAAIGNEEASGNFGISILAQDIQDNAE